MQSQRRLVLLRHAKSDWPPGVPDHDRPLGERGRREAPLVGAWLAERGLVPDLALLSGATRTRQTWSLVAGRLDADVPAVVDERLYDAGPTQMLGVVHGVSPEVGTVVVVGHNPGTQALALLLEDGQGPAEDRSRMGAKFPTSAAAVLAVDCAWRELGAGDGRLEAFVVAR